jgi:hypothetical protein
MDQEPETPFGHGRPEVPGRRPDDGRPIHGHPGRTLGPGEAAASRQNPVPYNPPPRQGPARGPNPALPARQGPNDLASQAAARRALDARSMVPAPQNPNAPQGSNRLPVPFRPPAPKPLIDDSDLTTTMPIFIPFDDDADGENPPPGEPGHVHSDEIGRHRGGMRTPRALILTGVAAVAVAGGLALTGAFSGNAATTASGKTGVSQPGQGAAGGVAASQSSTPSDSPSAAAAAGASPSDGSTTPSGSTSPATTRATPSPTARPTSSSVPTGPTMSTVTSGPTGGRESTAPVQPPVTTRTRTVPPTTPPTTTPAFTPLNEGDTGPAVAAMQSLLASIHYLHRSSGYQPGTFDWATKMALENFQWDYGTAPPDKVGTYGAATDAALRQAAGTGL